MVGEDGGVLNGEVVSVEVGGVAAAGVAARCEAGGVAGGPGPGGGPGGGPGADGAAAETEAEVPAASDMKTWALVVRVPCLPLDLAAVPAAVTSPASSPPSS